MLNFPRKAMRRRCIYTNTRETLINPVRGECFASRRFASCLLTPSPRVPRYAAHNAALGTNGKCIEPYPLINQRFLKESS